MKMILYGFFAATVLMCMVGCQSEYDKGVAAGRAGAREVRGNHGEFGAAALQVGVALTPGKLDPAKSGEFNAGFRDGFNKEVAGK